MHKLRVGLMVASMALVAMVLVGCGKKADEVLATVGKDTVTLSEYKLALANLPDAYKSLAADFKGKRQILDNLVKKSLLVQEAEDRGLAKDPEMKKRIADIQAKSREKLKAEIAELQGQLDVSDRQVYETLLVTELNNRLKNDSAADKDISDADVQAYYDDYGNKLKMLNPAAKVPEIGVVTPQIRAILGEEKLIKELEKKNKVAVEEEKFQKLYGDAGETALPEK